jgi:hypothetical protein
MIHKCACCGKRYRTDHRLFCEECLKDNPQINYPVKKCKICGEIFCPTMEKKLFCSDECSKKRDHQRSNEFNQKTRKAKKKKDEDPLKTIWWKKYKKADKLAKDCMLARRNGMSYGQYMLALGEGKFTRKGLEDRARQQELLIQERTQE